MALINACFVCNLHPPPPPLFCSTSLSLKWKYIRRHSQLFYVVNLAACCGGRVCESTWMPSVNVIIVMLLGGGWWCRCKDSKRLDQHYVSLTRLDNEGISCNANIMPGTSYVPLLLLPAHSRFPGGGFWLLPRNINAVIRTISSSALWLLPSNKHTSLFGNNA